MSSPPPIISKAASSSFVKIQDIEKSSGSLSNRIMISNIKFRNSKTTADDQVKRKCLDNQENDSCTKKKATSFGVTRNVLVSKNVLKPNLVLSNAQSPRNISSHQHNIESSKVGTPGKKLNDFCGLEQKIPQVITTSRSALQSSNALSCHCYGQPYVCNKCLERCVIYTFHFIVQGVSKVPH